MLNDYHEEILDAIDFLEENKNDNELFSFLAEMRSPLYGHSDRWARIFDWLQEHYPAAAGSIVTGLAYGLERDDNFLKRN